MTLEKINTKEKNENEAFLNWIKSPAFQTQYCDQRILDLEIYMIAKNREIADLEAEYETQAKRIAELEAYLKECLNEADGWLSADYGVEVSTRANNWARKAKKLLGI